MKHTEDIVVKLLQIRRANKLMASGKISGDNSKRLALYIAELKEQTPPLALSHFERLENAGKSGIAEVVNGRCSACGAKLADDELEYLKDNIGVCDKCFAFTFLPDKKFDVSAFLKDFAY